MLYLVRRKVINVYVYRMDGKTYRIKETLHFHFNKKSYKLINFQIEEVKSLTQGGEK